MSGKRLTYRSGGGRKSPELTGIPASVQEYLDHGSAEGGRNRALFSAACQLRDEGTSTAELEGLLMQRAQADGLSESEARTTINSALNAPPREPARNGSGGSYSAPRSRPAPSRLSEPEKRPRAKLEGSQPVPLPNPKASPFETLLEAAFEPGEFICIAATTENAEGERAPESGVSKPREWWLNKVRSKGGIDKVFSTKHGLFVRVNPMNGKGVGNGDATAWRHVLVEFDRDQQGRDIPKEEQFGMILASGLPVSVVMDSGNKSVHAWVRVDAPDAETYEERVDEVYALFADHHLDKQNRNVSRLSRCPGMPRLVDGKVRQQTLLMTNAGAESWDAWQAQQEARLLGAPVTVDKLLDFDTSNDPNSLLGKRWLCKGGSLVLIGQSGVGKSSMNTQLAIGWALGRSDLSFGIEPIRPLRSLVLQAENDDGDLAEMLQGVCGGFSLTNSDLEILRKNLLFQRITDKTGESFLRVAEQLVALHKPDLLWIDPLLNFIGDDVSDLRVVSEFCVEGLNRIAAKSGIVNIVVHHMGKPPKEGRGGLTGSDLAYAGLGSSGLTNWAREVMAFVRLPGGEGEPPKFQLTATKRRLRAGMVDITTGDVSETIYIQHSGRGITWEQCEAPEDDSEDSEERPRRRRKSSSSGNNYRSGRSRQNTENQGPSGGRPSGLDPRVEAALKMLWRKSGGNIKPENRKKFADKVGVHPTTVARWEESLGLRDAPISRN